MTTTTFTDGVTPVVADWLNDVDAATYETLPNHIADTLDAHAASAITNTPAGSIAATTVQAAINELDTEKQPLDTTLTALAGTLTAANKIPYATALDTAGELDFKDEDNMVSDSATAVPSQQSVKAYVDTEVAAVLTPCKTIGTLANTTATTTQNLYSSTESVGNSFKVTLQAVSFAASNGLFMRTLYNSAGTPTALSSNEYVYSYLTDGVVTKQAALTSQIQLFPATANSISGEITFSAINNGGLQISWSLREDVTGILVQGAARQQAASVTPIGVQFLSNSAVNFSAAYAYLYANC